MDCDPRKELGKFSEWAVPSVIVMVIIAVLRILFLDVDVVHGTSMCTTLYSGDVLIANRNDTIHRGDIVTAVMPGSDELIVKRVVGMPGEIIYIDEDGIVYVNEDRVDDVYQIQTVDLDFPYHTCVLSDSQYFLMGDNRYDSYDSRYFGPVEADAIKSVALFRICPFTVY